MLKEKIMDLINMICLVTIVGYTITREYIFLSIRERCKFNESLYYFVNCPYCFSFWVTIIVCFSIYEYKMIPVVFIGSVLISGLLKRLYED